LALVWVLACTVEPPSRAGELTLGDRIDVSGLPEPQLEIRGEELALSLDQAIELALERNLDLLVQRYDYARALEGIVQQKGIYDLNLSSTYSTSEDNSPSTSALDGVNVVSSEAQSLGVALRQLTPFGGVASFSWDNSRFATNNFFASVSPSFRSGANLSFVQPLLRNWGRKPTERGLLLARRDSAISREAFELQVVETLRQVENGYWELVRARKQLEVSEQSLALAKELHERNRIRVEVGTLAPFELVQSEAGIAQREGEIIRNQATVGDAEDGLRQLLNLPEGAAWTTDILTTTEAEVAPFEVDVAEAIRQALEARPEVQQERLRQERLRLDSQVLRNLKKPRLDLTVNYGSSGVDGRLFDVDPLTGRPDRDVILRDGGIGDAIDQLLRRDADGWSVDLTFAMPLQNRQARAQSTIADLAVEQGEAVLQTVVQQVSTEVRSAARLVDAAVRSVDAARASRRAQEKSLEAERKRFENGMSTSFQVLQIQEDLAAAQSEEVRAITDYRSRLMDFHRAVGGLLEEWGIQLSVRE
jgi:outer membrane protein TolC